MLQYQKIMAMARIKLKQVIHCRIDDIVCIIFRIYGHFGNKYINRNAE